MGKKTEFWFRDSAIDGLRITLETYRETQREFNSALDHFLRVAEVGVNENLDAVCTKVE